MDMRRFLTCAVHRLTYGVGQCTIPLPWCLCIACAHYYTCAFDTSMCIKGPSTCMCIAAAAPHHAGLRHQLVLRSMD
jgi:hypothetical protein